MVSKIFDMIASTIIIGVGILIAFFKVIPGLGIAFWAAFQIPGEFAWLSYMMITATTIAAAIITMMDPMNDRWTRISSDYFWDLKKKLGIEPEWYEEV